MALRSLARRASGLMALLAVPLPGMTCLAHAQAWTPAQGEGAVAIVYQDAFVKFHMYGTLPLDRGHIRSEGLLVDVAYGVTDALAVSASFPYIAAKYDGRFPHPTGIDNGAYHSSLQDFRFDVRYNLTKRGVVVTPFVGTILPSHDYQYFAHSAVGRDLRELQVGLYGARLLDGIAPGLFITGRYSYGFAERALGIAHDRSNLDLELGYFITPAWRVFAMGSGQFTHGGIDLPDPRSITLPPLLFQHHDQIGHDNILNLGGGASYSLTSTVDVFGSVVHTVAGRNMHALQYGATAGVSWTFTTRAPRTRADRARAGQTYRDRDAEARSLVKCLCQKGR